MIYISKNANAYETFPWYGLAFAIANIGQAPPQKLEYLELWQSKENVSFAFTKSHNICKCCITFNADILIRTGTVHTVLLLYFYAGTVVHSVSIFIKTALFKVPHFRHSKHKIFRRSLPYKNLYIIEHKISRRFLLSKNLYLILEKYSQLYQTNKI